MPTYKLKDTHSNLPASYFLLSRHACSEFYRVLASILIIAILTNCLAFRPGTCISYQKYDLSQSRHNLFWHSFDRHEPKESRVGGMSPPLFPNEWHKALLVSCLLTHHVLSWYRASKSSTARSYKTRSR